MYFKLSVQQENDLLNLPETGMGYQVIEAAKAGNFDREKYLVLNSELVIEMNSYESDHVKKIMTEGIEAVKSRAQVIVLSSINVLSEKQFRNKVNETKNESKSGAIENPAESANGEEIFVRLSPFNNDKRIDKTNKCLRVGSFTTSLEDYLNCKATNDDPVERYALPVNDKIKYAFHIQPKKTDTLQRGKVQPAYGKRGGGKEAYFAKGTAYGTFIKQTLY